jgi:hypothetical protein
MKRVTTRHSQSAYLPPTSPSSYTDMVFLSAPSFIQPEARDGSSSHTSRSGSYVGSSSFQSLPPPSPLTPVSAETAPGGNTEALSLPSESTPFKPPPNAPRVFHPPPTAVPWEYVELPPSCYHEDHDNNISSLSNPSLVNISENKAINLSGSSDTDEFEQNRTMPRKAKRNRGRFGWLINKESNRT